MAISFHIIVILQGKYFFVNEMRFLKNEEKNVCPRDHCTNLTRMPHLSMTAAKAYSTCLLDRVARVGEDHRMAAKRRAWVKGEEERLEAERKAHWHAFVRRIGASRGQFVF